MSLEEYEIIRLIDFKNSTQEKCTRLKWHEPLFKKYIIVLEKNY